jgi:hypothetical protein
VLRDCRVLYRCYPQIRGSATREFEITALPSGETETQSLTAKPIRGSSTREFPPSLALEDLMQLSWTHLQELIRLDDPWQRAYGPETLCFPLPRRLALNGKTLQLPQD